VSTAKGRKAIGGLSPQRATPDSRYVNPPRQHAAHEPQAYEDDDGAHRISTAVTGSAGEAAAEEIDEGGHDEKVPPEMRPTPSPWTRRAAEAGSPFLILRLDPPRFFGPIARSERRPDRLALGRSRDSHAN
jgi:hypothetical protein